MAFAKVDPSLNEGGKHPTVKTDALLTESEERAAITNCALKIAKGGCTPKPLVSAAAGDGNGSAGPGAGKLGEALDVTCKGTEDVKKNATKAVPRGIITFYETIGKPGVGEAPSTFVFKGIGATVGGFACVAAEIAGTGDTCIKVTRLNNFHNAACVITNGSL